jgi:hypothetical protein
LLLLFADLPEYAGISVRICGVANGGADDACAQAVF